MTSDQISPKLTRYRIMEMEDALFATRAELPNWKLADKSRRLLVDTTFQITQERPHETFRTVAEVPPTEINRIAVNNLAGITVRATGSAMAMIACGYELEAVGPARRGLEAKLRARAILHDPSGRYASRWLTKPPSDMTKLAQRYGNAEDVRLFSAFAHADPRGLFGLHRSEPVGDGEVQPVDLSLQPDRSPSVAAALLHGLAYESVEMAAGVCEASGVGLLIPPWITGELARLRDEVNVAIARA